MRSSVLGACLVLCPVLCPVLCTACSDTQPTATARSGLGERVSPAVWQALDEQPSVRVMIALADVTRRGDVEELRQRAAAGRKAVLDAIEPGDFALARSFETVAAMAGVATRAGVEQLARHSEVAAVSLDSGGTAGLAESVPLIGGDQTYMAGYDGAGVTVAVLDSGIDIDHPDLAGVPLVAEHCACDDGMGGGCCPNSSVEQNGPGSAADDEGHGTAVTAVIASQGVVASRGVAPGVSLVAVKVIDQNGSFMTSSQVVAGLDWIITSAPTVRVINMSLGSSQTFASACDSSESWTMALAQAIDTLSQNGVAVFAISGNNAKPTEIQAPGCIDSTITVGAVLDANLGPTSFGSVCSDPTTAVDRVPCFSNASTMVDLLGPGAMITTSQLNGATEEFWGTSLASPHAAGGAAVLWSIDPTANVQTLLEDHGVPVVDTRNGLTFPRIDLLAASQALEPPACGDGAVQIGEACDDGNTIGGDGCSDACDVEDGFACSGEPSSCASQCGDGTRASDEACDDGNTHSGDGCSAACSAESTGGPPVAPPEPRDRCEDCCCRVTQERRDPLYGWLALVALAFCRRTSRSGRMVCSHGSRSASARSAIKR